MEVVFNVLEKHSAKYKTKLTISEEKYKELKEKGVNDSDIIYEYATDWEECGDLILEETCIDSIEIIDEGC